MTATRVEISDLETMKREGRKIVGVVAWDYPMAQIADRAGVDIVSVGDSVGVNLWGQAPHEVTLEEMLVDHAKRLEDAGASLLDFRHSGPVAGEAVASAVRIPVIGGLGGGPWLDGRMRMAHAAIGYAASSLDDDTERYANVAQITLEAIEAYAQDVRAGRQIKGASARKPPP